jgi:methylated-DNA-[protein]-cysteine S-methyltransferase
MMQLQEYFAGTRKTFDFKLNPSGTEFQQKVWQELLNIPYGKTTSYLGLSKKLGDVKAIRAVASANGKNPLWIVVPCHRVIGSDGSLTGYAGGLWRKQWLLEHESGQKQQTLF